MVLNSLKVRVGRLLIMLFTVFFIIGWSPSLLHANVNDEEEEVVSENGSWGNSEKSLARKSISVTKNSQYLTIQDTEPINTITVKVTNQATGAMVFENVYPQGQTGYIVISISNWDAGSYIIELFGRENNGYLWGTFQVLP